MATYSLNELAERGLKVKEQRITHSRQKIRELIKEVLGIERKPNDTRPLQLTDADVRKLEKHLTVKT